MTGAGSGECLYRLEESYGTPDTDASWIQPGIDVEVGDINVNNEVRESRQPNDATAAGHRVGNYTGTADVTFVMTDANFHDLLPLSNSSLSGPARIPPTAEWYFAVDLPDGSTEEIQAAGAVVTNAQVSYQQGEDVTVTLSLRWGDIHDTTPTSSNITRPSVGEAFTHHGTTIEVAGQSQAMASSATLDMANLARHRPQQGRTPYDAVVDAMELSFSSDVIFSGPTELERATGASTVPDQLTEEDITFAHENGNGTTVTYTLTDSYPEDYSWSSLIAPEEDLSQSINYRLTDVQVA